MMRQKYKPTFSTQCTCCFREPKTCLGMKTVTVCHLQTWIQNFEIYVVISSFFKFDFWVLGFANFIFPKKDVSTIHSLWFANIAVPSFKHCCFICDGERLFPVSYLVGNRYQLIFFTLRGRIKLALYSARCWICS